MAREGEILVGLDIGSTKICAIVGEVTTNGIDIIGVSKQVSKGVHKGVVMNIETVADCAQKALEEAEVSAGCEISSVIVNIAGSHIQSSNSQGVAAVKGNEVAPDDILRVIDAAKAVALPAGREIIHVIPQVYTLDGRTDGISEPLGMSGVRLESKVHIVTAESTCLQNIQKCASRRKLEISDMVLSQLASSEAILASDEKELGCIMLDIGGGTTDISVWVKGVIVYSSVLNLGGNLITQDISTGLKLPLADAERLKLKHGNAVAEQVGSQEILGIPSAGSGEERQIPKRVLSEIIEPRMEEIIMLTLRDIENAGVLSDLKSLGCGLVLTGGCAMLQDVKKLAERITGLPVRIGMPRDIGGMSDVVRNPTFSTAVGLILFEHRFGSLRRFINREEEKNSWPSRLVNWFKAII